MSATASAVKDPAAASPAASNERAWRTDSALVILPLVPTAPRFAGGERERAAPAPRSLERSRSAEASRHREPPPNRSREARSAAGLARGERLRRARLAPTAGAARASGGRRRPRSSAATLEHLAERRASRGAPFVRGDIVSAPGVGGRGARRGSKTTARGSPRAARPAFHSELGAGVLYSCCMRLSLSNSSVPNSPTGGRTYTSMSLLIACRRPSESTRAARRSAPSSAPGHSAEIADRTGLGVSTESRRATRRSWARAASAPSPHRTR